MQKEYYCYIFMQQLIIFYICYTRHLIADFDKNTINTFIDEINQTLGKQYSTVYNIMYSIVLFCVVLYSIVQYNIAE